MVLINNRGELVIILNFKNLEMEFPINEIWEINGELNWAQ